MTFILEPVPRDVCRKVISPLRRYPLGAGCEKEIEFKVR